MSNKSHIQFSQCLKASAQTLRAINHMGNGRIAPRIRNLGTGCKWVASFMPRPLRPPGKVPSVSIEYKAQWVPASVRGITNDLPISHSPVAMLTMLSRLPLSGARYAKRGRGLTHAEITFISNQRLYSKYDRHGTRKCHG